MKTILTGDSQQSPWELLAKKGISTAVLEDYYINVGVIVVQCKFIEVRSFSSLNYI